MAFQHCSEAFSFEMSKLVLAGNSDDAKLVLEILRNYHGEPTVQRVLKDIVFRHSQVEGMQDGVSAALETTGLVRGNYGRVDALRSKKQAMVEWFADPRENIGAFSQRTIAGLELRIVAEQKRAEEEVEMRRHRFVEDA